MAPPKDDLPAKLGRAARKARERLARTQQDIADELGVSVEFYSRVERGVTLPSLVTFVRLLDALDTSADALLGREAAGVTREGAARYRPPANVERLRRTAERLNAGEQRLLLRVARALRKRR